ncbi:MAG: S-formylglutathione hydrolase [Pseudomonadota bacterium]
MEITSTSKAFGGAQHFCVHESAQVKTPMTFSVFVPPQAASEKVPALLWLSGLTCTAENFTVKAGAQRKAAELGLALIAPDTSPRGDGVPDDPDGAYDFGLGAGFYVNATASPFDAHYRMRAYVEEELLGVVADAFPIDVARLGLSGHSMGGHGALTIGLRNPGRFRSVSAFSPIVSPMNCPWGRKALRGYLGDDAAAWRAYDACALLEDGCRAPELLVEQGLADPFLEEQLRPELLVKAARDASVPLTLNYREGYDHSYYFIASFIDAHLAWHRERL